MKVLDTESGFGNEGDGRGSRIFLEQFLCCYIHVLVGRNFTITAKFTLEMVLIDDTKSQGNLDSVEEYVSAGLRFALSKVVEEGIPTKCKYLVLRNSA